MQKTAGEEGAGRSGGGIIDRMLEMFGVGQADMSFVRKRSIYNQFFSDLVTPLKDGISVPGTAVHIFYAVKMGERYEARYRQHFKDPGHPRS